MKLKLYQVEAKLKFPGCYHTGYSYEFPAKNKADAIKAARRFVWSDGHTRQDGPLIFIATEISDD